MLGSIENVDPEIPALILASYERTWEGYYEMVMSLGIFSVLTDKVRQELIKFLITDVSCFWLFLKGATQAEDVELNIVIQVIHHLSENIKVFFLAHFICGIDLDGREFKKSLSEADYKLVCHELVKSLETSPTPFSNPFLNEVRSNLTLSPSIQ
jgi:hypothetical protein